MNTSQTALSRPIGRLHVLTDFFFQQRYSHAKLAELAIRGGADTIQFRQKKGSVRHKLVEAMKAVAVCHAHNIPFLVNDELDLVLATGADGVHLGQEDLPVDVARRLLGSRAILGASATSLEEAQKACDEGADYIGFGPVFPTTSKANPASVKGLQGLEKVCQALTIPVIAIAGITPARTREVLEAGAHGVAVMTAITNAPEPDQATQLFRAEIDAFLNN